MCKIQKILSLIVDMSKVTRCCQQDSVFCDGVTFTQFYILQLIAKHDTLALSDLHNFLSVEKSTSTRLIDPLVKRELVIREKSLCDCRAINLRLSEKGKVIHKELWITFNSLLEKITDGIPEDKFEEVFKNVMIFNNAVRNVFSSNTCSGKC